MIGKNCAKADWQDLHYFLALADCGSFLGAAQRLGVEHATVSRRIASLEAWLGLKLIDRRGRRIELTLQGKEVARLASPVADQVAAVQQYSRSNLATVAGQIRISAPPALSSSLLALPLIRLRKLYPALEVTLIGEKRFASLDRREADIAVRLSRPTSGDYIISLLGQISFFFYATEKYLNDVPEAEWTFIGYDEEMDLAPQQKRLLEFAGSRPISVRSSVLEFQTAAAGAGGGVAFLPEFAATEGLKKIAAAGSMLRDVWLVLHSDMRDLPSIRVTSECLRSALSAVK